MKTKNKIIEIKTTVKNTGMESSTTGITMDDYHKIIVDGKTFKIPLKKIIHNNSVFAYQEYATRRYKTDLDFLTKNEKVTLKIKITSPLLPNWLPFKSLFETVFTTYDLVPYWKGYCYNILETKIVYTKEQYEKGTAITKNMDRYTPHYAGCDEAYPGICIADAGSCFDFTTGEIKNKNDYI